MKRKKKKEARMVILEIYENEMEIHNSLRMIGRNEFCDFTFTIDTNQWNESQHFYLNGWDV